MAGFNVLDFLPQAVSSSDTKDICNLKISLIDENEMNSEIYTVEKIDELAEDIQLNGLIQPLVVCKSDIGIDGQQRYRLIVGHRRRRALIQNHEETAPCIIVAPKNKTCEELMLITSNSTARELTFAEKSAQVKHIEKCLIELKEQGVELPGKMRARVAEIAKVSQTEVANMKYIDANLETVWRGPLKDNKINKTVALSIAHLSPEMQNSFFEDAAHLPTITEKHINRFAEKTVKLQNSTPIKSVSLQTIYENLLHYISSYENEVCKLLQDVPDVTDDVVKQFKKIVQVSSCHGAASFPKIYYNSCSADICIHHQYIKWKQAVQHLKTMFDSGWVALYRNQTDISQETGWRDRDDTEGLALGANVILCRSDKDEYRFAHAVYREGKFMHPHAEIEYEIADVYTKWQRFTPPEGA